MTKVTQRKSGRSMVQTPHLSEISTKVSPPYLDPVIFTLVHSFFPVSKPSPSFPSILTSTCFTGVEEEGHASQQVTGPSIHLGWLLLSGMKEDKNFTPTGFLLLPLTPRFDVMHAIFFLSPEGNKAYSYRKDKIYILSLRRGGCDGKERHSMC